MEADRRPPEGEGYPLRDRREGKEGGRGGWFVWEKGGESVASGGSNRNGKRKKGLRKDSARQNIKWMGRRTGKREL